ncbi:MAG: alpha/beta hydrolase-fold protein [Bacteroidota bacterium]
MKVVSLVAFLCFSLYGFSQDFTKYTDPIHQLSMAFSKPSAIDELWGSLKKSNQIPFVAGDSVAFLYRGAAKSVEWMGDFNGWGYDKKFNNKGKQISNTDVWILKASFPKNARLDYKIVLGGYTYILDPENPNQQWSGVGGGSPNSELRMPDWKEDTALEHRDGIPHGKVKSEILFQSKALGYQITYSVYLPYGYQDLGNLPVIYVTDGFEYMHPKMGNMVTILDNLILDKKIIPIIAIFIDHREPVNRSNNRRMDELAMNEKYMKFFTAEFIPLIEQNYPVTKGRENRAILGTSMGGLTSAYFIFSRPEVFGMAGIQSPSFWSKPQIYSLCDSVSNSTTKISMTSGVIHDASESTRRMKTILEKNSCIYTYRETNEGHSWGNWRNLIDDILIDFFGVK